MQGACASQAIVLHRQQVHSKLVLIMRERLAKTLQAFPSASAAWAANAHNPAFRPARLEAAPLGSAGTDRVVSAEIGQLVKQVTTLAAVLKPIMSHGQLVDIFFRVRRMYGDSLARCAPTSLPAVGITP